MGLLIIYGFCLLFGGGFLIWLYTPSGKRWLKNN